ncbi:MAG: SDR family oxidoreductase [Bdellovibrionales bacterium]|nr:SDR family oxidoreductase [Bdellovibrionales bacterium]
MNNLKHKVLITGASQGIGAALACEFAKQKATLVLVARTQSKLESVADKCKTLGAESVQLVAADLSEPASWDKVAQAGAQAGINILVNNAGYGLWGEFAEQSLEALQKNMRLNMDALLVLTHKLIPTLKKSQKSYVMNVSSTTAYQALPTFATYAASKSFVLMWSRALHHELKKSGISVTALVPGATDTGFIERANMQHMEEAAKKLSMTPEAVAQIGISGMFKGKMEVVPGLMNKVSAVAVPLLPKKMVEKIAANIYIKKQ